MKIYTSQYFYNAVNQIIKNYYHMKLQRETTGVTLSLVFSGALVAQQTVATKMNIV